MRKLLLFALLVFRARTAEKLTLTIDTIMSGPALVGYKPGQVRWSGDSRQIYFQWKRAGQRSFKLGRRIQADLGAVREEFEIRQHYRASHTPGRFTQMRSGGSAAQERCGGRKRHSSDARLLHRFGNLVTLARRQEQVGIDAVLAGVEIVVAAALVV